MTTTTKAPRFATLFAIIAPLLASAAADARPHKVAVLDFDGPRALADDGKAAVIGALADGYDVVASKHWLDAKAAASRRVHGPQSWAKASKASGVDAVIEGWVQDEGRSKVLTLIVTDASNGDELDQLTIKLGRKGITSSISDQVKKGLEDRFEWIEPINGGNPDPLPEYNPKDNRKIGARSPTDDDVASDDDDRSSRRHRRARSDDRDDRSSRRRSRDDDRYDRDDRDDRDDREVHRRRRHDDDDVTIKEPRHVAAIEVKSSKADRDQNILANVFRPVTEEEDIVTGGKASHVPRPTVKARVSGGGYYESRTLYIGAANQEGVTQYAGVPNKGLGVGASFYPFPTQKIDGIQSGIGFSFGVAHSLGSVVTFDDGDQVGDYVINQSAWDAGVHYRAPLGSSFAIDGEVGYGARNYVIEDAPMTFEVPDTSYSFLSAGGHLDLKITERASVGFGAKYLYMLGTGDLSSTDWYGPGGSAGWHLDSNFIIPLPSNLYVEGEFAYTRIKTSFDGVGEITEAEGVSEAVDSNISGSLKLGIAF